MILNLLRHYPKIQAIKPRLSPKLQRCVKLSRLQAAAPATGDRLVRGPRLMAFKLQIHKKPWEQLCLPPKDYLSSLHSTQRTAIRKSSWGGKQHDTLDLITLHLINSFELPLAFHLVKSSQNGLFWRELKRTNQSTEGAKWTFFFFVFCFFKGDRSGPNQKPAFHCLASRNAGKQVGCKKTKKDWQYGKERWIHTVSNRL